MREKGDTLAERQFLFIYFFCLRPTGFGGVIVCAMNRIGKNY